MDFKKITYTVSWTQHPKDWNIPNTLKILENARNRAIELENKKLEEFSFKQAQELIERVRTMQ